MLPNVDPVGLGGWLGGGGGGDPVGGWRGS